MSKTKSSGISVISSWIVVILWIVLIFTLSVQTAEQSAGLSIKVTEIIFKTVSMVIPIDTDVSAIDKLVKQFHNLVRKSAHAGLYFVLGGFVINSFIQSGTKGFKAYVYALLFCVAYAVSDELHQTFVVGRSGQVSDILIDTVGAIIGISMYWIYRLKKG
jgi:VanZ family protein